MFRANMIGKMVANAIVVSSVIIFSFGTGLVFGTVIGGVIAVKNGKGGRYE